MSAAYEEHGFRDAASNSLSVVEALLNSDREIKWRWVVIATVTAISDLLVAVLTNTQGGGALEKRFERENRIFHEMLSLKYICSDHGIEFPEWLLEEWPKARVESVRELTKRLPLKLEELSGSSEASGEISELFDLRDAFVHTSPENWLYSPDFARRRIKAGLNFILAVCDNITPKRAADIIGTRKKASVCLGLLTASKHQA